MQLHKLVNKEGVVVADELTALQKEREKHVREIEKIDGKIEELTAARRQELLEELKALGWQPTSSRKSKGNKREPIVGTPCGVCGFATDPYHDGRIKAHRDQGENKRAFTDAQLEKLGLKKVKTEAA